MAKQIIYADNAATTKLDAKAFEAMVPWMQAEYGNASQPYSFSRKPKEALANARECIALCIGAEPEEIYFTSGGTESDNWAIKRMLSNKEKRTIITTQIEHHAILHSCATMERMGYSVVYLPVDNKGIVSDKVLSESITDDTGLVSVMMVNNEIGTIEPIKELAAIAHDKKVLFHTDAVQAVGHIPINVKEMNVDMLSASAHKFNGPKGIGFIYVRKGISLNPYLDGGSQEFGKRAGTENVAAIVGMAVALRANCEAMARVEEKLQRMEQIFLNTLREAEVDYLHNGAKDRVPGNVNISLKGISGEALLHRLDLKGILVSTGSACDSENTHISHVIEAIGVPKEYAGGTIRISFGKENTETDAVTIAEAIIQIVEKIGRKQSSKGKAE